MRRFVTICFIAVVVLGSFPLAGVTTADQEPYIVVTNVSVTPENPTPGTPVTIRATIRNGEDSPSALTGSDVALRGARGTDTELEYARVDDLGAIPPGTSVDVPLTVTFQEPGVKRLRVVVFGQTDGSFVQREYPLTVRVLQRDPQIDVRANDTVVGTQGDGRVVISNGLDSKVRNLELTLQDSSGTIEITDQRSIVADLASGETRTVEFTYEGEEPGTYRLTARLQYQYASAGNQTRRIEETVPVTVDPLQGNVTISAQQTEVGSDVLVDIINNRNLPMEDIIIEGTSPNASVEQRFVEEVPTGSSRSIPINTSLEGSRAAVDLTVQYQIGDRQRTVSESAVVRSVPGRIDLTGIEIQHEDGRLQIGGSASNVGLGDANSVVVRVKDTARVTPAPPAREYFVGTVPSSDFVSFEVYARVEGEVSSIPLEVTYLADETRHTKTIRVPYETEGSNASSSASPSTSPNGGNLIPLAFGSILAIGVGVVIFVGWRNSRGSA